MANYNNTAELFDDEDFVRPKKRNNSKRRWREIERAHEKRRLSKELARNDTIYFDLLEQMT